MTIIFADGVQMYCLGVHGSPMSYQGVTRDCLTFLFPQDTGLDMLLDRFTPERCGAVRLLDETQEEAPVSVHEGYTLRVGAGIGCRDSVLGGAVEHTDQVAWVKMAQTTPAERQLQAQQETLDALLALSLEGGAANA